MMTNELQTMKVGSVTHITFNEWIYTWERILMNNEDSQVDTGHWQGLKNVPHTRTRELQYVNFLYPIPETQGELLDEVKPNMPWAEEEFQERVGGEAHNPHESVVNWPWYKPDWEASKGGHYHHTYSERYWPKVAGNPDKRLYQYHRGIRYDYGDLQGVVSLLAREPTTRQAYLPVWFPEDTGAAGVENQRVPCSLGYHFMMRDGRLNCMYHMRSCDLIRYFRDDVYLTCRLVQWVLNRVQKQVYDRTVDRIVVDRMVDGFEGIDPLQAPSWKTWRNVKPGTLHMTIASLHVFEGDLPMIRRRHNGKR